MELFILISLLLKTMCSSMKATVAEEKVDPNHYTPVLTPSECEKDDPLGMISGSIADWQITASSTYPSSWIKGCSEGNARLYRPNGLAWCAKFKSSSEWIQIDLGVAALVTGIMTQGRGDGSEWVTSFMLSYSDNLSHWNFITDQYGNQKIFEGNTDAFMVKHNYLDEPVKARYVKLHTYTWHNHPSLRLELVGCQPCKQLLGVPPYARYSASSSRGHRSQRSCMPEYGHYLSNKGWCSRRQDTLQWLQIDVGPPTQITGVLLKGRGETKRPQYVSRFKLSYSNDTRLWYFYKDAAPLDPRIFDGNNEHVVERVHYLTSPFTARYIRIHPVNWRSRIAMRVGLIGCRQKGPCLAGFFRINNESSCVANLAYKKSAWITPENSNHQKRNLPDSPPKNRFHRDNSANLRSMLHPDMGNAQSAGVSTNNRPMMAKHRIGDVHGSQSYPHPPFWSVNDINGHRARMMSNVGDPMASLAVDGLLGDEFIERNSSLKVRSSEQLMNDEPNRNTYDISNDHPDRVSMIKSVPKTFSCTVLEYRWPFIELPSWHVDLREQTEVNGVVIYTAGHGRVKDEEKNVLSSVHMKPKLDSQNLERLSIYVETEPRSTHGSGTSVPGASSSLCGFVTRLNDAIFHPRLHIPCRQPLVGRFVYVEARGVRGRWSQEFSAMLCEVLVY